MVDLTEAANAASYTANDRLPYLKSTPLSLTGPSSTELPTAMGWLATVSAIAMAVGPPCAYLDQYIAIIRSHNSSGFSLDISGLLIVANVTRVFYWLGDRFQTALLVQSFLMILAQFALLYVCLLYRPSTAGVVDPASAQESEALTGGSSFGKLSRKGTRPGNLWQWRGFGSYVEFVALLVLLHCSMFLVLHSFEWYVTGLGFVALGLEATLPIPQALINFERKSTAGFRRTVLAGWVGGDAIKTIYFFLTPDNSASFKACAIFQLSIDLVILAQTVAYRAKTKRDEATRAAYSAGVAGPGAVVAAAGRSSLDEEHEPYEDSRA